ncbi:MAG: IRE (iron responsive element) [Rubripirellula sp.]|nr:IRE (iron responsive element) [Rubripirellula sp.]
MNRTTSFRRKLIYLTVMVAMLIPLYLLGQPAGGDGDLGGRLSVMRNEYNIAESDLGEISPASETMKLASLGLRGVAATLLWNKAHEYRVMHEWDRLKATLNNIALLQPHFDKVWEHQAHNLAYNVSTEFDDYRQRYEMVREGTEFLTRGLRQNTNATRLVWYTGWFYGAKMGMSDEKEQFRRLFSEDELLHESLKNENIAVDSPEARGPLGKPDNWLVGRLWLNHGYDIVDSGVKIRRQTPLNFYETGPKWRLKHAESIESEGVLDQRAQNAWLMASDDWASFGQRSIPTTSSFTIKLGELDILKAQRSEKIEQFRMLNQEVYDAARDELIEALPDEFKAFYDLPSDQLTFEQRQILPSILDGLIPNLKPIAKSAQDDATRLASVNLIDEIANLNERILKTNGYRTQINYPYWEALALAEQEERTVEARRLIYEAEKANAAAELDESIRLYEEAFAIWEKIFDDYPLLTLDDTAEDLFDSIRRYMVVTDSEEIPEDFPLIEFAMMMGELGRIDSRDYQRIREEGLEQVMQDRLNSQEIAPGIEGDSSQNIPSSEGIPQPVAVEQPQDVSLPQGADK